MAVRNWLNFGKDSNRDSIQTPKTNTLTSTHVSEAAPSRSPVAEAQHQSIKILAVQDGVHSQALADYVVKMAYKLDCEIVALDVSEDPLSYEGERRQREINRFNGRARKNAESLQMKAEALGVKCRHIVKIGNREETIKALSSEDNSIRYVLTKPRQALVLNQQKIARVQVSALNRSRL